MPGSRGRPRKGRSHASIPKKTPMQYTPEEKFKENEHVKIYTEI